MIQKTIDCGALNHAAVKIVDTAVNMLSTVDERMRDAFDIKTIDKSVSRVFGYICQISDEVHGRIDKCNLELNNYNEQFGIGCASVRIVPLWGSEPRRLNDEEKNPTLGAMSPIVRDRQRIMVGFSVNDPVGAEKFSVLSENFLARTFAMGEPFDGGRVSPLETGTTLIIPQKSKIGVVVEKVNERKLGLSSLPFDGAFFVRSNIPGQVYFCRYLTKDAAAKVLGLSK